MAKQKIRHNEKNIEISVIHPLHIETYQHLSTNNLSPPTMAGLEQSLFQLKFTAKQLNRQATKASKKNFKKAKIKRH